MPLPPPRIYIDTSVFGGCFDEEFASYSVGLFQRAHAGAVVLVISTAVLDELRLAPARVRDLLTHLPEGALQTMEVTDEVLRLAEAYLHANVVGPASVNDAVHVAAATVDGCDAIVSWNFRHIVRLDRIQMYNEVNRGCGYRGLVILTPVEVYRDPE